MTDEEVKARAMAALLGVDIEVLHPHIYLYLGESLVSRDYWACCNWSEAIEWLKEITVDPEKSAKWARKIFF